tara:strand:- start:424 stop:798 length:375 start_codon:yes stop_codon:yes gene_type:complete
VKYLLIAVFIFVVGCSGLEEKVFTYKSDKSGIKYDIKIKFINGSLNYVFDADLGEFCTKRTEDGYIVEFADKDNYKLVSKNIYKQVMFEQSRCNFQDKGIVFMVEDTYKKISKVNFYRFNSPQN